MCVLTLPCHDLSCTSLTYSQHGQPQQILDMGETALDEQIFEEYLAEMRGHYTADKVCFSDNEPYQANLSSPLQYHLLGK
jgi:hypothetical protein